MPGHRAELLAADPRQRAGEHLADRRPDRHQGVRRRHRRRCAGSADDVLRAIAPVRGVARAFVDRGGQVPQLQIEIDRAARGALRPERRRRRGRDRDRARRQDGDRDLGRRAAIRAWSSGSARTSGAIADAIRNVLVDTPAGLRMPLSEVADVSVGSGSMNIAANRARAWRRSACSSAAATWAASSARCSSGSSADVTLAARLLRHLGRRVREPAARDGAAERDRARSACC